MASKKRLGRGLDVLLGGGGRSTDERASRAYKEVPIAALAAGKHQPRHSIADDDLAELVASIRQQGVLQPLVVRELSSTAPSERLKTHEIVAGERRWRAARLAGLERVPVVVHQLDDQQALAIALIENLQREDLNPLEIAESLAKLTGEFSLTHKQAAEAVGRSRSAVSNFLRLLDLEQGVQDLLTAGSLDMGHARALLSLDAERQVDVAKRAVGEAWSVRKTEQAVAKLVAATADSAPAKSPSADTQTRWLQQQLAAEAGLRVGIRTLKDGSHTLGIGFSDLEQLQAALKKIESLIGQVRETAGPRARDRD